MTKNQQKYNFSADKAQAEVEAADNVAAMQECVAQMRKCAAEVKLNLNETERLHNSIKLQLISAISLEETVEQIMPELQRATAIKVTARCKEDYGRMCSEEQVKFKDAVSAAVDKALADAEWRMAKAVDEQIARVRRMDARVSIPWPLAIALCWLSGAALTLAVHLRTTEFRLLTEESLNSAIKYTVGLPLLASIALLAIWCAYVILKMKYRKY